MEKKRKVGRPAKEPVDLITMDEAVTVIKEYLMNRYNNPTVVERCAYSKGTLYNKTSSGELNRWRKGKYCLVSKAEVLKLVS
jgi:hypothetical protein